MNERILSTPLLEKQLGAIMRTLAGKDCALSVSIQGMHEPDPLGGQSHWYIPPRENKTHLRGVADRIGFARRLHDHRMHERSAPSHETSRAVFDLLERIRIEWEGAAHMRGAWHNMQSAWHSDALAVSKETVLVYTIRALMLEQLTEAETEHSESDALVHQLKAQLSPCITDEIKQLIPLFADQQAFAKASMRLIELLARMGHGENSRTSAEALEDGAENREEIPSLAPEEVNEQLSALPFSEEHKTLTEENESDSATIDTDTFKAMEEIKHQVVEGSLDETKAEKLPVISKISAVCTFQYHIFSTRQDEIIMAEKLVDEEELNRLRRELDEKLTAVQGSFAQLSSRLQRLLLAKKHHQWQYGEEEGVLDAARLARLVSQPDLRALFKQKQDTPLYDTVVTLLLDNSGSMRGRPITIAALSSDILSRVLERAGIKVEILGFTTREWKGGAHAKAWIAAGKPADPGRLNELRHIIYKAADTPYVRAKKHLGLMLKEGLLKENIDGEALQWAYRRLLARPEKRRILMVISDGAPVDDATLSANHAGYLDRHLHQVIARVEADPRIELTAIGIGHDVTRYYRRSICLKDVTKLGETMAREMVTLFSSKS